MTRRSAPARWLDSLPPGDPLRSALQGARGDLPDPARLDRVHASVIAAGGLGGGPGDGGDGGGGGLDAGGGGAQLPLDAAAGAAAIAVGKGAALSTGLAKVAMVAAIGAASLGTAIWVGAPAAPEEPRGSLAAAPSAPRAVVAPAASAAPSSRPELEVVPAPSASAPIAPAVSADAATPGSDDVSIETSLLREAQASIASNPARSLELVAEAERRFPRGPLSQERVVIRVQALIGSGRRDEALSQARALLARSPETAHRPRLEQLLPELR